MSVKYFCDSCGTPITEANSPSGNMGRIVRRLGNMIVEIMVARSGTWNAGDFCVGCILHAAEKGHDVPWLPAPARKGEA